jgi:hypothetical protein
MKKLLLLALLATMMVGCEEKGYKGGSVDGFDIVIVDSCEYIISTYAHGGIMAHKGNCRFCAERNKRMVHQQVDSILLDIFE